MSEHDVSRRQFFVKIGILLNGLAAVVLATPIVGYVLAPLIRGEGGRYRQWIDLGELDEFPEGQTRLAKYKNPISNAWDGETDNIPCWVRRCRARNSRYSPSTARIWDVRFVGSRSRDCLCVRVTVVCITGTDRVPRARRSAACLSIRTRLRVDVDDRGGSITNVIHQRQPVQEE